MKQCRACAESIQDEAVICRYCRRHVDSHFVRLARLWKLILEFETVFQVQLLFAISYGVNRFSRDQESWLSMSLIVVLAIGSLLWAVVAPWSTLVQYDYRMMIGTSDETESLISELLKARARLANEGMALALLVVVAQKLPTLVAFPACWTYYWMRVHMLERTVTMVGCSRKASQQHRLV